MTSLYAAALGELTTVFERIDDNAVDHAVAVIAGARRIALFGLGAKGCRSAGSACASSTWGSTCTWSAT